MDGSKTNEGTGFGTHGLFEISRNMNNMATLFQAEAKAVSVCAKEIENMNIRGRQIIIYSDSQAVLKAIAKNKVTSRSILECIEKLQAIGEHNEVKLIWIPGHEGHDGNEKSDALARQRAASTQDPNKVECFISLQIIRARIKN